MKKKEKKVAKKLLQAIPETGSADDRHVAVRSYTDFMNSCAERKAMRKRKK